MVQCVHGQIFLLGCSTKGIMSKGYQEDTWRKMYEVEKGVMQQSYPLVYEYYIYYGLTVVGIYIMV